MKTNRNYLKKRKKKKTKKKKGKKKKGKRKEINKKKMSMRLLKKNEIYFLSSVENNILTDGNISLNISNKIATAFLVCRQNDCIVDVLLLHVFQKCPFIIARFQYKNSEEYELKNDTNMINMAIRACNNTNLNEYMLELTMLAPIDTNVRESGNSIRYDSSSKGGNKYYFNNNNVNNAGNSSNNNENQKIQNNGIVVEDLSSAEYTNIRLLADICSLLKI